MKTTLRTFISLFLYVLCIPAFAQTKIVIITGGINLSDITHCQLPEIKQLLQKSSLGLMNCAVSGPHTQNSAILPLAIGAIEPSAPDDTDIRAGWNKYQHGTILEEFRRRTGISQLNKFDLFAMNIASITRRKLNERLLGNQSGVAANLRMISGDGHGCPAALMASNSLGIVPTTNMGAHILLIDLLPRNDDPLPRIDSMLRDMRAYDPSDILLISAYPHPDSTGAWDHLAPVLWYRKSETVGILTSNTTRTSGIVANVDMAPTILKWIDPSQSSASGWTGHSIAIEANPKPLDILAQLDQTVAANGHAEIPLFVAIGIIGFILIAGGIYLRRRSSTAKYCGSYGVIWLLSMPIVSLIISGFKLSSGLIVTLVHLSLMSVLSAAVMLLALKQNKLQSLPVLIAAFTVALIVLDAITGQNLIKFSCMSGYMLQGIRFYGIGNEFMGILMALVLYLIFSSRVTFQSSILLMSMITIILVLPTIGAKAGGAIVTVAGFGAAILIKRGKQLKPIRIAGLVLGGILLAFTIAFVEKAILPSSASHLGNALQNSDRLGIGYLGDIIVRKVIMNFGIALRPQFIAILIGIAIAFAAGWSLLKLQVLKLVADNPEWFMGLRAVLVAALVAAIFNDAGFVAALFMVMTYLMPAIYTLLLPEKSTVT